MGFREPRPLELRPVMVTCQVPRPIADAMVKLATAKGVSLSQVMRQALVKVYAPEPRDE